MLLRPKMMLRHRRPVKVACSRTHMPMPPACAWNSVSNWLSNDCFLEACHVECSLCG